MISNFVCSLGVIESIYNQSFRAGILMAVMSEVLLKYRFIYGCERVANAFVNFIVSIASVKTCVLKVETLSGITDS